MYCILTNQTPGRSTSTLRIGSARCVVLDPVDLAMSWPAATSATPSSSQKALLL